ncbi:hypothetical protein ACFQY5_24420 [Paeniroseomonas aquatica]|uniref:NADP transhydrogenase beta-like domain-containing protein n=1 Tax=Paeniroseomonas aquatica TaxID=373043 RepID=A0ABT8A3W1_9PROT|nr:hypothetical protein [Paeniroseomonas aquatica]MDN3564477.1 hypothetical protein [Paeniroseomonas aquatica]
MSSPITLLPHLAFLALAILAAVIAGLAAARALQPGQHALNLGAAVFLGQFLGFVALAALGLPSLLAQGTALGLGVVASMAKPGPA